jgi:recombinational DNA repair ATPase RecF
MLAMRQSLGLGAARTRSAKARRFAVIDAIGSQVFTTGTDGMMHDRLEGREAFFVVANGDVRCE